MSIKTPFKWSQTLTASQVFKLIKSEKDVNKAIIIFDSATAEYGNGFKHDHTTFSLMISKLVSANHFGLAESMLTRMKEEKCNVTEDIFLTLCNGYGRVHRPLDAIRVFDKMNEFQCQPTLKAYVTIFDILVEENQLKIAMRFYRTMREKGFPVSVVSLNVLIKALCKSIGTIGAAIRIFQEMPKRGCFPDSYTYGTLINGLCKLGRISEAKELFKEMKEKGCSPSVVTYTLLIHGLCQANKIDEGLCLFEEMKRIGVDPNVFTYSCLIDGLCKDGRSSEGVQLMEIMVGKRYKPNTITYSSLIDGLCKEGKLNEATEILDRMKLQGLKPDAGLYGKIISGLCCVSKFQEAANFLDEMVLSGVSPSRLTWSLHVKLNNMVVVGLCSCRFLNRAFFLYVSIRSRGISIDAGTFDSLVKCFCKKGDLQKAACIVDEMLLDGVVPDSAVWAAMVRGFVNRKKVQEAFDSLMAPETSDFLQSKLRG